MGFLYTTGFLINHMMVLETTLSGNIIKGGSFLPEFEDVHSRRSLSFPHEFLASSECCHILINGSILIL